MKELSIEEKAKAYDLAIDTAKKYHNGTLKDVMETIFPELKEMSEDEKTRKEIVRFIQMEVEDEIVGNKWLAWLEKQSEQKPAESRQETKPNGGIVYEDFNDGDGSYKVNLAYLSKPQVELIENLVASWQNHANNSVEWSEEDKDFMYDTLSNLTELKDRYGEGCGNVGKCIDWLKSLKQRIGG